MHETFLRCLRGHRRDASNLSYSGLPAWATMMLTACKSPSSRRVAVFGVLAMVAVIDDKSTDPSVVQDLFNFVSNMSYASAIEVGVVCPDTSDSFGQNVFGPSEFIQTT